MPASSRLAFAISEDGLSAYVSVIAGDAMSRSEWDTSVDAAGIRAGIVSETHDHLAASLEDPQFTAKAILLAVGQAKGSTQDPWVELAFLAGPQAGHLREDGSVDYHDHELLKPVCKGDVVGRLHPAILGSPGQLVSGITLPPTRPRALELRFESGIEIDQELQLCATRNGVVLYRPGHSLDVVDSHVHQGPVDRLSGSLNMHGSLVVRGDVMRPFSVAATGNVEIHGTVDSASVRAGGHLRVNGGIRGGEGGAVCAESDMFLHHAESAELHCGGRMQLREAVNSRASAVEIHTTGRWRGGSVVAENHITMQEAGAPSGIETHLAVGEPLELPVSVAQRAIATVKAERMAVRLGGRSDNRSKGGKTGRARTELDGQEIRRLAERARRRDELLDSAYIEVAYAHTGVTIRIGDAQVILDEPVQCARYSFDRERLTIRTSKP